MVEQRKYISVILLVNGGEETRTAFASALDGRLLRHAPSVEAASELLTDVTPDLIVADETMPDGSAAELLRAIQTEEDVECSAPFVTLTEDTISGDVTDLEFDGYLRKPVTSSRVEEFLERLEIVGEYDAAVERLFHLSQNQARAETGAQEIRPAELAAAKREADEYLDALQHHHEGNVFESLLDEE